MLTARGVLYSRGESYDENRFYSDPGDWPQLAEAHRREFLERTDRGVFSLQAEAALSHTRGFRSLAGRAAAIEAREHDVIVTIEYGDERERVAYDAVVVAIGFDGRWFEALLGAGAAARYRAALGGGDLRRLIDVDLSVAGLTPPLHLPVMAGLAQGPGFPNLSCLGLLSDRILRRYVAGRRRPGDRIPERREDMPELSDEGWERDDHVRRTVVLPAELAQRLAAEAGRRGISVSDLLAEYAEQGLRQAR